MRVPYVDIPGQYRAQKRGILKAVSRVLAGGKYILGEEVAAFERKLARLCGVPHAVGVANGTDALVLAFKALGLKPGDEVITVPNSFVSSVSSIALAGGKPVFTDVGPNQLMDPACLERAITRKTKAIVPVHLTGKCCDMRPIMRIARKHRLAVVEDAAQALGSRYHGRFAGSFGHAACFSFHPLKNLNAVGDAGAVVTGSARLARKLTMLRNHGLKTRDEVSFWGYNSRLDSLQAAVLNYRLGTLHQVLARRRRNARLYRRGLQGVVDCPADAPGCFDTYHLFVIQCDRRDALRRQLRSHGISTAIHYPLPAHLQPVCRPLRVERGELPRTEEQSSRILSLPVHQLLSERQVRFVIRRIRLFYGRRS